MNHASAPSQATPGKAPRIPLAFPEVTDADVAAVTAVLRSGRLSLGPQLDAFERSAAAYLGTPGAVGVSSGTCALHVVLHALGIGRGDEVITPAFSFVASASSVLLVGAEPVFADADPRTLCVDPAAVERAVTPRTRAIVAVHVFGHPAPMRALADVAARHGLALVEDACEALGTEVDGRRAGALGDAAVFGFYPNKQVTTGEGGLVTARDPALLERARRLRDQGRDPAAGWLGHVELGYSYRLSDLHAALGVSQLARIEAIVARREELTRAYDERLGGCDAVARPPAPAPGERISRLAYVVRLADRFSRADRDRVVEEMARRGIQCGRYFAPVHRQPLFLARPGGEAVRMPVTEHAADRCVALPFFHALTDAQVDEVCGTLVSLLAR